MRAMTRDDAAAVAALLGEVERVDRVDEHFNVEDVLEVFANPLIDPARDWLLVEAGGELVASGMLMPRAVVGNRVKVDLEGVVLPSARGRGIGTDLLGRLVRRAEEYAAERGADPDLYAAAPADNEDFAAIMEAAGFVAERWELVMFADLGEPRSSLPLPAGYTVHTWVGVADDELRQAHNAAFAEHYGFTPWSAELWQQWVSGARSHRPELSLLSRDRTGAVAAYVHTQEFDAVEQATGVRDAYVGKVGTLPAHRGRGLAGALLSQALDRYGDAGFERASLDVDSENPTGALGVYERAGFRVDRRWANYRLR